MSSEEEEKQSEEYETHASSQPAYTREEWRRNNAEFVPITTATSRSSRWQRPVAVDRPDLAPGSEYHLFLSKTPTRGLDEDDPAIWPDDLVDWDSPDDPANPRYHWH